MLAFILRRLALLVPVLLGVSIVVFSLIRLIPGDPASIAIGADRRLSVEQRARIFGVIVALEPGGRISDQSEARRVGIVNDEVIREEVVIALDLEVVRLLDPERLDRDDLVPVHVGICEPREVVALEMLRETVDDPPTKP